MLVERRESRINPDRSVTTRATHAHTVECPATTATTTFGLLTSDGRLIRFDEPSNARVIEIVNSNQSMNRYLVERTPLSVSVVGADNGDVAIVESLNPGGSSTVTVAESRRVIDRGPVDVIFNVRHGDDRGKLLVTAQGVQFEDVSDADHSRGWSYAEIKELKREGDNKIKIEPRSGDSFEFRVEGPGMSDTVYEEVAARIVAARGR
jgi:hypothetical protein